MAHVNGSRPSAQRFGGPDRLVDRFLAAIVESSDDAIIGKTLDGTITSWNQGAERLYGYTAEEAIGQHISLIIPADRPDELPTIMEQLRNGQRIDHYETLRVRKDGVRCDVSVSISPIRDDSGQVVGAASIGRDITERVQATRELRELEQRAQDATRQREVALQETSATLEIIDRVGHLLVAELDLDRLIQSVTDAATTLTGAQFGAFFYNALDARGEYYTLYAIAGVPREAFSQFPLPRNTAMFGPTFRGEGTIRIADVRSDPRFGQNAPYFGMPAGHLPVVSYLAVPVIGREGTVLGGLFFGHHEPNVFGERAARLAEGLATQSAVAVENARLFGQLQRELVARRESEARFRAVWDATSEALALSDPEGLVLDVNPAYCVLYGRSAEEFIGHSFALIFSEPERPAAEAQYRAIFADPSLPLAYEARVQRPDGSERIVEARADFLEQDGQRVAMVSALHDITERKQLDQAQHDFVAMVSHDLASPLTVLRARAQILQRRQRYDEESVSAILEQTKRMGRLIDDLRALAQVEGGALSLAQERVDLVALAQDAVDRARTLGSSHTVRMVASDATLAVVGDADRLGQVLDNLLGNAIKYSQADGEIVVRVERMGDNAQVSVSDQGLGIPADVLPTLFERFVRGAHTSGDRGLGLGLYITRMLVEAHGGQVWATSQPGMGSTFTVTLPLVVADTTMLVEEPR